MEKIDIYQAIIIDVLNGHDFHDIMIYTGLSEERSREIEEIYKEIEKEYKQRHNLG